MQTFPLCLATHIDGRALERILAEGRIGGYRDTHPWYVGADLLAQAQGCDQTLVLLLASGRPPQFTHWAVIEDIEVHRLASTRETRLVLGALDTVSSLFAELESVTLAPSELQLRREQEENLRPRRVHLDPQWLHPYAICETPPFISVGRQRDGEQHAD